MQIGLIYITAPSIAEAEKISKILIDTRLAACTNIFPIKSMYLWENEMKDEKEVVLIAKTLHPNYELIKEEVKKIHSYKIPCVLMIKAEVNKEYYDWIKSQVTGFI
jgi:periplasmic divalent cation tolerance protein